MFVLTGASYYAQCVSWRLTMNGSNAILVWKETNFSVFSNIIFLGGLRLKPNIL